MKVTGVIAENHGKLWMEVYRAVLEFKIYEMGAFVKDYIRDALSRADKV
jgi:hypothetical protein